MQIFGELIKDIVIIKNPKDVGRLYNKSNFGKPLSGNKLELDLLEGIFLLDEGKILITKGKEKIDFETFVFLASKKISHFEIKYFIYKDMRKRGHAINLYDKDETITFSQVKNKFYIIAFSERDELDLNLSLIHI